MKTEVISFEKELEKMRNAGFTKDQTQAIWELVARVVMEVAHRLEGSR